MRNIFLLFLASILMYACTSVQRSNAHLQKPVAVSLLHKDIDKAYGSLQKNHPELYWYISKKDLDYQFDSLKKSITAPLLPNEFYFKLAPVIARVKEGHLRLRSLSRRYTKKETKEMARKTGLFSQLSYMTTDDLKMYISENKDSVPGVSIGALLLAINGRPVADLMKQYAPMANADGENTTYKKYAIDRLFWSWYTAQYGYLDSAVLLTQYEGQQKEITLVRKLKSKMLSKNADSLKGKPVVKQQPSGQKLNKKIYDFDKATGTYNRELKFMTQDSSVAYIKVKRFSGTGSKLFYSKSFRDIKLANATYLILDIRDNLGGSLAEIHNLYAYLSKEPFQFIKRSEVNYRTAFLNQVTVKGKSAAQKIFGTILYPVLWVGNRAFTSKAGNGRFYTRSAAWKKKQPHKQAFEGKVYVLTNGASFSASSILASKIKYDGRATIVGEETGGANDGTVAGINNVIKLQHSKLILPIGVMLIQPNVGFDNNKRGVIPHKEILPGWYDRIHKKDTVLDWVLDDIKNEY